MKSLGLGKSCVVVALLLACSRPEHAAIGAEHPSPHVKAAATAPRPGDSVARDEAELSRWLADPAGPREIWLEPRTYHGDFVVTRSVHLRGQPGSELVGSGQGTVLSIEAEGAAVEDLLVRHSGRRHTQEDAGIRAKAPRVSIRRVSVLDVLFGVSLGPCADCVLEEAHITGASGDHELRGDAIKLWEASGSRVERCVVEDSRDVVVWYSRRVQLLGNRVTRSRYGAHFMYAHDSKVLHNRFVDNVVGVFVMYSARLDVQDNVLAGARGAAGMGIGFKESDAVSLSDNWLVANTTGVYLDRTPRAPEQPVRFERNVLALNDIALSFHSSERGVAFHDNDFRQNHVPVEVEGGGDATGVDFSGNFWSDYAGYDLDGDAVGDVGFDVLRLGSAIAETHPSVKLLDGTLAMGLIDVVARAVPVFASERLLSDPRPRMATRGVSP